MSKKSHHFLTLWPWPLTYDLEKLIRSGHYHCQCVYQIWEQSIPWFLSYRVNTIAGGGRLRRKTITSPDPSDTGDIIYITGNKSVNLINTALLAAHLVCDTVASSPAGCCPGWWPEQTGPRHRWWATPRPRGRCMLAHHSCWWCGSYQPAELSWWRHQQRWTAGSCGCCVGSLAPGEGEIEGLRYKESKFSALAVIFPVHQYITNTECECKIYIQFSINQEIMDAMI